MNLEMLKKSGNIIYECIAGSRSYHTHNESSDFDVRGVFTLPLEDRLSLSGKIDQVSDSTNDTVYYELAKFMNLVSDNNPNMIELLWIPDDCVKYTSDQMKVILDKRDLFVSKKSYYTHIAYAKAQLKRCRGQNKWINCKESKGLGKLQNLYSEGKVSKEWIEKTFPDYVVNVVLKNCGTTSVDPQDLYAGLHENLYSNLDDGEISSLVRPPQKEDYCWIIPLDKLTSAFFNNPNIYDRDQFVSRGKFPMRPIPLSETDVTLDSCKVAKLEHVENTYRLYDYGSDSKGVFRNNQLVVDSIPKNDEWDRFIGFLVYNDREYKKAMSEHKNYWTWRNERDEARYVIQELGEVDFDSKNVMHTFRLLWSGKSILENGEPIVRFEGEKLQFLKDVRAGKYEYDFLIEKADDIAADLEDIYEKSDLRKEVNKKEINKIYLECLGL